MKTLTKEERKELKRIQRRIQTNRATMREFKRAISLTSRDHAEFKAKAQP